MGPEEIYTNLGNLVATVPDFRASDRLTTDETVWMARAYALLRASHMNDEALVVKMKMDLITSAPDFARAGYFEGLLAAVHRALAVAELQAPTSIRGAFISAGSAFDAMAVVGRVLGQAKAIARIVDPYMDEKALTDFAVLAAPHVRIEILADAASAKPSLLPAVNRWRAQYTSDRKLEARLSAARALHDRLIVIDDTAVYTLTQSLNAFAARSPASIVRLEGDAVPLKIAAYEAFWTSASVI